MRATAVTDGITETLIREDNIMTTMTMNGYFNPAQAAAELEKSGMAKDQAKAVAGQFEEFQRGVRVSLPKSITRTLSLAIGLMISILGWLAIETFHQGRMLASVSTQVAVHAVLLRDTNDKLAKLTELVNRNAVSIAVNAAAIQALGEKVDANTVAIKALAVKVDANTAAIAVNAVAIKANSVAIAANAKRLDRIESRLDKMDTRLTAVESRLDKVESRLTAVESRLTAVEFKLDTVLSKINRLLPR